MNGIQKYTNRAVFNFTKRALVRIFYSDGFWTAFPFFVAVLALVGPLGTFELLNALQRVFYWFAISGVGLLVALMVSPTIYFIVVRAGFHWIVSAICGGVCAGPFVTLYVLFMNTQITMLGFGILSGFWSLLLVCTMISIAGTIIFLVLFEEFRNPFESEWGKNKDAPNLLTRLEPGKRGPVLSLQAQGHYIEVVTTNGSQLVLMRLKDAIRELDDSAGRQVHRSWWVSKNAVKDVRRIKGKPQLTLPDGKTVPVSKFNLTEVKAWLSLSD